MRRYSVFLVALVAASLGLAWVEDQPAADLTRGISLIDEGRYEQSIDVLTRAAIALQAAGRTRETARAHFHVGVAYVGMGQTERAASSMDRAASADCGLRAEPNTPRLAGELLQAALQRVCGLRPTPPPSPSPRASQGALPSSSKGPGKALLIGGGAALAGGAVALAARGGATPPATQPPVSSTPAPTPAPSLAPLPSTVTPTSSSGPGAISYRSAVPPPGSTLSNCRTMTDCRINLILHILSNDRRIGPTNPTTSVFLFDTNGRECFFGRLVTTFSNPGESYSVEIPVIGHGNQGCAAPVTINRMSTRLESSTAPPIQQDFQIAYHVQP